MYYLGNRNEVNFVTTAVKLGYPMLTKKMDNITTAAMWQESNISLTSQRIILRYLSNSDVNSCHLCSSSSKKFTALRGLYVYMYH